MSKTNYQVSIGYRAVFQIDIKADNEEAAKKMAIEIMKERRELMLKKKGFDLADDNYDAHGCVDLDQTWNML